MVNITNGIPTNLLTAETVIRTLLCNQLIQNKIVFLEIVFSFLREILKNISRGLRARLDLNKMSEEEQSALAAEQKEKIKALYQACVEVFIN